MGRKVRDLTGQKFGMLTVIERAEDRISSSGKHEIMWLCKCDCGNKKTVTRSALTGGLTKSCGCLRGENHGMCDTRLYNIWIGIKKRCENPNRHDYNRYGGRGISICDEWKNSFSTFYNWALNNGYDDTLSIDRENVNGDYEPNNCRWSTEEEQANNKRNNVFLTYNGKTQTVSQWARELNIGQKTIINRINKGFSDEEALTMTKGCGAKKGITYQGQTKTLRQWAEYINMPYKTLSKRIWDLHWDLEKALTTPIKKRGA